MYKKLFENLCWKFPELKEKLDHFTSNENFSENEERKIANLQYVVFDDFFVRIYECTSVDGHCFFNYVSVDPDMLKSNLF